MSTVNICLIPKALDGMLFQFNMELGKSPGGDHHYVRQITVAQATPGVTWQQIIEEFELNQDNPQHIMMTTTFVWHRYLLYMTIQSFYEVAVHQPQRRDQPHPSDYELLVKLAKDLIAQRDYEAAGGYFGPKINGFGPSVSNFYPKD